MLNYMLEQFGTLPVEYVALRESVKDYITEQQLWCEDREFSSRFPFRETGLPQDFFQQKVIYCDGNEYLTGPRYKGSDLRKPFVDVVASSAPLTRRALVAILDAWEPMGARSLRLIRLPSKNARGMIDQFFYAGTYATQTKPEIINGETFRLERATMQSLDWCLQTLHAAYEYTYSELPLLKNKVIPADDDDVLDAITAKNLYMILSEESYAGFIICEQGRRAFLSGHWVTEVVVLPRYRGKNLSSIAQRALPPFVSKPPLPVTLWGTIESSNIPSIRAAEHAGRQRVMEYVFLEEGDIDD